jgi:hypothetical protein
MKVFTVTSTDDLEMEPLARCVAGSYTTREQALDECVAYMVERLGMRSDLAWSMAHDENHPEAKRFFSERMEDGRTVIRRGCQRKLREFIRGELDGQGCYYAYDGSSSWHFDIDENGVEGQLWTTVTWGDSDCEDPEFTTPFPETFVSKEKAIENFYLYALDLKGQHGIEVSDGFRPWVYDTLEQDGKCQVDLDDGCCVSCVLYSTPAGGIRN